MAKKTPEVPETTVAGDVSPPKTEQVPVTAPDIQALVDAEVAKRMAAFKATPKTGVDLSDLSALIAKGTAEAMAQVMPQMAQQLGMSMLSAQQAMAMGEHQKLLAVNKAKLAIQEKCHICRQPVGDGKSRGCGGPWRRDPKTNEFVLVPVFMKDANGKNTTEPEMDGNGKPMFRRVEDPNQFHHKRAVFPSDPIAAKWFFGVIMNGAIYQSQGPNHEIWVPNKNDIDYILGQYTTNELEQRVGRSHTRLYGGTVSGRTGGASGGPGLGVGFQ